MHVEDIEHALVVARLGAIARAAQEIGMSQPALSKSLARLEAELKTRLFERHARGVRLTEEGRLFLEHGARAAMHAADARRALRDRRHGLSGVVRLGVGVGVPSDLITGACTALARQGRVRYVITGGHTDSLLAALRGGELDLIVSGIPQPAGDELQWTPLWPDPMVPFIPRSLPLAATPRRWSLRALGELHWILPPAGTVARGRLESAFVTAGLPAPEPLVESRASGKEAELARALGAIALMPLSLARDERIAEGFVPVQSLPALVLERTVSLLSRRSGYTSPVVARFGELLASERRRWSARAK